MLDVDFLQLQAVLVTRLQERLGSLQPRIHVLTSPDLDGVMEEQQLTPAVHLIYQGYRVLEQRRDGAVQLEQTWLAVVVCRNVSQLASGQAARNQAGKLAAQVLAALMGYQPPECSNTLALSSAPPAGYSGGHQYLPLAFTAELFFKPHA